MAESKRTLIPIKIFSSEIEGTISLILRLLGRRYDDSLLTTIGRESYIYETDLHGFRIKIKIFIPLPGDTRIINPIISWVKSVDGMVFVYSITDRYSLNYVTKLLEYLNEFYNSDDIFKYPLIIIGIKLDKEDSREVSYEEGQKIAKSYGCHFYEVSAETGENVKIAFDDIFDETFIESTTDTWSETSNETENETVNDLPTDHIKNSLEAEAPREKGKITAKY